MKYTVHIYPIVRVTVLDVEAENQTDAIDIAEKSIDLHSLLDNRDGSIEYSEDIDCFHVDQENDPEYLESTWYDKHNVPM